MDLLLDARAWLARARGHIQAYNAIAGRGDRPVWRLEFAGRADGSTAYAVVLDRARLAELKIISAEAASALFQALDHVVAAGARVAGASRHNQIMWPFKLEPDQDADLPGRLRPNIGRGLADLEKRGLPKVWCDLIIDTYAAHAAALPQIDAVKQVSISGKHWELVPTGGEALAVAWNEPGLPGQSIRQIPLGHFKSSDHYVFHEGAAIPDVNFQMVIRLQFQFPELGRRHDPGSALMATVAFVQTAIGKASDVLEADS